MSGGPQGFFLRGWSLSRRLSLGDITPEQCVALGGTHSSWKQRLPCLEMGKRTGGAGWSQVPLVGG